MPCLFCERELTLTKHHLLPREFGGDEEHIVLICSDCHRQIHALYTNKELALRLSTVEALRQDETFSKFLKFIKKQAPTKKMKVSKSHRVKRKGHF